MGKITLDFDELKEAKYDSSEDIEPLINFYSDRINDINKVINQMDENEKDFGPGYKRMILFPAWGMTNEEKGLYESTCKELYESEYIMYNKMIKLFDSIINYLKSNEEKADQEYKSQIEKNNEEFEKADEDKTKNYEKWVKLTESLNPSLMKKIMNGLENKLK